MKLDRMLLDTKWGKAILEKVVWSIVHLFCFPNGLWTNTISVIFVYNIVWLGEISLTVLIQNIDQRCRHFNKLDVVVWSPSLLSSGEIVGCNLFRASNKSFVFGKNTPLLDKYDFIFLVWSFVSFSDCVNAAASFRSSCGLGETSRFSKRTSPISAHFLSEWWFTCYNK